MGKLVAAVSAVVGLGAAIGLAGCGSSNPTGSAAQKSAFCGANIAIDKAGANVQSATALIAVLKAHQSQLDTMKNNYPGGSLGNAARAIVTAAEKAISQNSVNPLDAVPSASGGDLDTYCGVDGNGNPLPPYFSAGKGTPFCNGFLPIYEAVSNASTSADALNVLVSDKAQIAQLASEVPSLPSSIQARASATVSTAQAAIAQNSTAPLQENGNGPASFVALYCGQNQ
jgi:hypothetical protein